jgi:tagaturonate epimerase
MTIDSLTHLPIYSDSVVQAGDCTYFLLRAGGGQNKRLGIVGPAAGFDGERQGGLLLCPLTSANAAALRAALPWLQPQTLGLQTSAGFGDRLGLATPGHVRAMRKAPGVAPIFAQQSIRENARTGRTPQGVLDDATWGVFQEGWQAGYGADADHLKTPADIDVMAAAGYTFFTIDPGEHVDDSAHSASPAELAGKVAALPWTALEMQPDDLARRYLGQAFELEHGRLIFDEQSLLRAAAKYGRAVAHVARMHGHLASVLPDRPWEMEVSVDETETPTSHLEHLYIVLELKRLGVRWVSLAPRYVGRFEKGVDYIGDLAALQADLAGHAAIARAFGPYKLSLHSGSDKFSVYPLIVEATQGMVHLKTAGTSLLEAQRAIAQVNPGLFRTIYALAFQRYDEDRKTYHVSAQPARAPRLEELTDDALPAVLDQFDAREMLHVTFGSALARHGDAIKATLRAHEDAHYAALEAHFDRHLAAFARRAERK